MFRFKKINGNLYQYRNVEIKILFDNYDNASMLAEITAGSGESIQFYSHSFDFEKVKLAMIRKIDEYLEEHSNGV